MLFGRRIKVYLAVGIFMSILGFDILEADIVRLKNKNEIEGKIIEMTGEYVRIKIKIGEIKIDNDLVSLIIRESLTIDTYKPPESEIKEIEINITPTNSKKDDIASKDSKNGVGREEKFPLTIKAEYIKYKDSDAVLFNGKAEMPDSLLVNVFLKSFGGVIIGSTQSEIKNGVYSGTIYPVNINRLFVGEYIVEAFLESYKDKQTNKSIDESVFTVKYILVVGDAEKVKENKEKLKKNMVLLLERLDTLYLELLAKYEYFHDEGEDKFQRREWIVWSKTWKPQVEFIKSKIENNFNGEMMFEFVESPMIALSLSRLILQLHNVYYAELINEASEPAYSYAATFDVEQLKKSIEHHLKQVKDKLNM